MMHCSHGFPLTSKCVQCVEEALGREDARKPKSLKPKSCKQCRQKFIPRNKMHTVCSPLCAKQHAESVRQKKEFKELMEYREKNMKLPEARAKAGVAFRAYIRARDKGLPCISCGKEIAPNRPGGTADAGHFRGVGRAAHMEFVEDNVHVQCKYCNRDQSGNHSEYRIGLIARIGLERVEAIECDNTPRHYSVDDFKEMACDYRKKTRDLLK
jgi:hypothetical protein